MNVWNQYGGFDPEIYEKVYEGETSCNDLEQVFAYFQDGRIPDFQGRSLSVSDVIETSEGFFFCDTFGFTKVDFTERPMQGMTPDMGM